MSQYITPAKYALFSLLLALGIALSPTMFSSPAFAETVEKPTEQDAIPETEDLEDKESVTKEAPPSKNAEEKEKEEAPAEKTEVAEEESLPVEKIEETATVTEEKTTEENKDKAAQPEKNTPKWGKPY